MSVLDRKLLRELRASHGLLLAIISIIAAGVADFVALSSSHRNLTEARRRYYAQCRMADFWIDMKKVPVTDLSRVAALPGVIETRPRIQFFVPVDLEGVTEPINGLVLSLPDRRQPVLCDIVLQQGDYFTDRRENEVIVNDVFARRHKLRPGQWIYLVLNNRRQELFIVGTAISSEFIYLLGPGAIIPDPEHFGVFYIKHSYAEHAFDFDGAANQLLGRLSPEAARYPRPLLERAEQTLESYGVLSTTPLADQASNWYVGNEIQGLRSFAFLMPSILLTVAALVLNVLLTRLAQQQRTVIGTLKALGYTDAQIAWHLLKFGLVVGIAGGLAGDFGGYWLAELMTYVYRSFYQFPELNNQFHFGVHASGVLISVLCAAVGSLRGCRIVLRLRPAEAMRPAPPRQGGRVLLERAEWLWRRLSSGWRMVLRGVMRNRRRTAAGMFAAALGASVLVNAFMTSQAIQYLVDFQFRWLLRSDLDLTFKDERGREALLEAARLPGVDRAEPLLYVQCTFANGLHQKRGTICGIAPDARLTVPRDLQARRVRVPSAGLAMSRKLAEVLHLRRGDQVTVRPTKGLRQEHRVPIVEIADSFLGLVVYADIHYLSRLVGEELATTGVQLALDGDPSHVAKLYRELKQMPALEAVTARKDMIVNLDNSLLRNIRVIVGILVGFAGTVFFGSILNASLVSLAERQGEIATLRVLGYGPWEIGSLLLRESLIVTMSGTVFGLPVGYLLTRWTTSVYNTEVLRIPVVVSGGTWAAALGVALLFALLTHLVVQRIIHRMDWLEALKVKE